MIVWIAPGQGSESAGMGRALLREWPEQCAILESLEPGLHGTDRIQPALVAVALATAAVLRDGGVRCDATAGHSVGELAAWAIAGGATPAEAVALARERGRAMAAAAEGGSGAMWAVPKAPEQPLPGLVPAVYNPDQVVFSGDGAPPPGARRVPVAGAWHSPAMRPAIDPFGQALQRIPPRPLSIPLVSNHDGSAVHDDATFRRHLLGQLTSPVHWTSCLRTLAALGCTDVVLLGPGKTLARGVRQELPRARIHRTERPRDVRATVSAVADGAGRPRSQGRGESPAG